MLTSEENKSYWNYAENGNKYYENQWASLRNKMKNKNHKEWEEKKCNYGNNN